MIQTNDSAQPIAKSIDTIFSSRLDTLYIDRVDPEITQTYLNILSDTNSQLNSSYTPLVVSITILTALIGLGAIAAGYFIWRQGKDFKDRQDEILKEFSDSKDEYIQLTGSIKGIEEEFNVTLNEVKKKLKETGKFDQSQTVTIESTIDDAAKKLKNDISLINTSAEFLVECKSCKKVYLAKMGLKTYNFLKNHKSNILKYPSQCPDCGTVQQNVFDKNS